MGRWNSTHQYEALQNIQKPFSMTKGSRRRLVQCKYSHRVALQCHRRMELEVMRRCDLEAFTTQDVALKNQNSETSLVASIRLFAGHYLTKADMNRAWPTRQGRYEGDTDAIDSTPPTDTKGWIWYRLNVRVVYDYTLPTPIPEWAQNPDVLGLCKVLRAQLVAGKRFKGLLSVDAEGRLVADREGAPAEAFILYDALTETSAPEEAMRCMYATASVVAVCS